jgi:hypothetical protein
MQKVDLLGNAHISWEGYKIPAKVKKPNFFRYLWGLITRTNYYQYSAKTFAIDKFITYGTTAELWVNGTIIAEKGGMPECHPQDTMTLKFKVRSLGRYLKTP